jgi:hypothetical protein
MRLSLSESTSMEEEILYDEHTGARLKRIGGDLVSFGEPIPYWEHRTVLKMGIIGENKRNHTIDWLIHIDCGHTIRETTKFDESPKGLYRDCSPHKKH